MKTKKYGKQKIKTFVLKKLLSTAVLNLISNKTLNNYVFSIHTQATLFTLKIIMFLQNDILLFFFTKFKNKCAKKKIMKKVVL